MPPGGGRTLRPLRSAGENTAESTVLVGFDRHPAAEATGTSDRMRGLLTRSPRWSAGPPRPDHPAVTWLLERHDSRPSCGTPAATDSVRVCRTRARTRPGG
ncbi:hypothetical protein [Streptomyces sp. TRM68416]|uniref:hypothetical protein n=1 Tax=Streptomyces sp. TRM68416 TaxID=2758412 RepID=UPI001661ABED|nr:hypothetical protein [Streptomyces sp. TRM68416]